MKRFRTSLAAKTAAVLLALAVGAGGFWSTVFILYQWDTLWLGSGYYDSNDYYSDLYNRSSQVHELARLLQNQEWNGALPYLDQRRLDMLEEALSPERTNFRFAIRRNDTGTLVYSNLEGAASLDESVHAVEQEELSLTQNGAAREQDLWSGTVRSSTTSSISPFPTPLAPSSSSPRRMPGSPPNTATPLTAIPGTMTSRWTAG